MSVEQVRAALECRIELPPPARHVLLVLAWYADADGGRSWPSVSTLSHHTGLGRATVQRALRTLESGGLIRCTQRSSGALASVYHLHIPPPPQPEAPHSEARFTPRRRGPHTVAEGPQSERKGPQSEAQSVLISPESQKDAGARTREEARRPREWRDDQGRLYASPGNGSHPTSPAENALALERQQREERARVTASPAKQSPAPGAPAKR